MADMKKGGSKALRVAAAVAACATGLVFWLDGGKCNGFGDWAEHALFFYEDDTVWAEEYSEEGFLKIEPGMSCEEVVRLVGWPLYERRDGERMRWEYAQCGGSGWDRWVDFSGEGRTVEAVYRNHFAD